MRMRSIQNKTTIKQYEYKIIRYITRSTNRVAKPKYNKQSINAISQNVRARYNERVRNGWGKIKDEVNGNRKFKAGRKWRNEIAQLPTRDKRGRKSFLKAILVKLTLLWILTKFLPSNKIKSIPSTTKTTKTTRKPLNSPHFSLLPLASIATNGDSVIITL